MCPGRDANMVCKVYFENKTKQSKTKQNKTNYLPSQIDVPRERCKYGVQNLF
jgi:hypothetical protein